MKPALRVALAVAVLAVAGYLAWRIVAGGGPGVTGPRIEGPEAPVSVPGESQNPRPASGPIVQKSETPPRSLDDRIEGVVYDDAHRPLADAEVQVVVRSFNYESTRPADRRFEERIVVTTITDRDGRYSFGKLVPGELKTIRALKPGFVAVFADDVRVPKVLDLQLVPGVRVKGRVVDTATKSPVAEVGVKGWNGAVGGVSTAKWTEEVFTDAAGNFVFEGIPAGTITFMLAHPDYVDRHVNQNITLASVDAVVLEMQRGFTIEGIVLDKRSLAPVPDARVGARDENPVVPRWTARTDRHGVFRMRGVRPGKVPFEIAGRRICPLIEIRTLDESADFSGGRAGKRLEFQADPAGSAKGRVLTRLGEPVVSARVFVTEIKGNFPLVRDPSGHGGSLAEGEVRTDSNGAFLVEDLANVPIHVVAEAPGHAIAVSEKFTGRPGETIENVLVTMDLAPVVQGVVTSTAGSPVADAQVTISVPQFEKVWFRPGFDLGQPAPRVAATDAAGRYRVELPYAGKIGIKVDHPDYVVDEVAELVFDDRQAELKHDVTLKPALSIAGTVTRDDGRPEIGAIVRAWPPKSMTPIEVKTDSSGAYALRRLPGGHYRIGASSAGSSLVAEFRDDVPAGSTGIDFRLAPLGEITGVVTLAGGTPVREFRVSARPMWDSAKPQDEWKRSTAGLANRDVEVKGVDGAFRIQDVAPAAWALVIIAPGYPPTYPVVVRVAPAASASAGTIVMEEGSIVHGKIVNPTGGAAEGVVVSLSRVGNLPTQDPARIPPSIPLSGKTDSEGKYELRGMTGGRYFLKLQSDRYLEPLPKTIEVPDQTSVEQSFTLRVAARVEVWVRDEVGEPVSAALINVLDGDKKKLPLNETGTASLPTDEKGRLSILKLPAGENLTFRAVRVGFVVTENARRLPEGDAGIIEIRLERIR